MSDTAKLLNPRFGLEVKEQLFNLNMTQTELAEKLNVSVAYLSDILTNKRLARRKREEIASVLKLMEAEAARK